VSRPLILMKAGDDRAIRIGIRNSDGSARDLTGETIDFRAAPSLSASAATIFKTDGNGVTMVDAQVGLVDIVFTSVDTVALRGALLFELQVTGVSGEIYTTDFGDTEPYTYGILRIEAPLVAQSG
jgi:hypothetical protein